MDNIERIKDAVKNGMNDLAENVVLDAAADLLKDSNPNTREWTAEQVYQLCLQGFCVYTPCSDTDYQEIVKDVNSTELAYYKKFLITVCMRHEDFERDFFEMRDFCWYLGAYPECLKAVRENTPADYEQYKSVTVNAMLRFFSSECSMKPFVPKETAKCLREEAEKKDSIFSEAESTKENDEYDTAVLTDTCKRGLYEKRARELIGLLTGPDGEYHSMISDAARLAVNAFVFCTDVWVYMTEQTKERLCALLKEIQASPQHEDPEPWSGQCMETEQYWNCSLRDDERLKIAWSLIQEAKEAEKKYDYAARTARLFIHPQGMFGTCHLRAVERHLLSDVLEIMDHSIDEAPENYGNQMEKEQRHAFYHAVLALKLDDDNSEFQNRVDLLAHKNKALIENMLSSGKANELLDAICELDDGDYLCDTDMHSLLALMYEEYSDGNHIVIRALVEFCDWLVGMIESYPDTGEDGKQLLETYIRITGREAEGIKKQIEDAIEEGVADEEDYVCLDAVNEIVGNDL